MPLVIAAAIRRVTASIRSGIFSISEGFNSFTPSISRIFEPIPSILAPMETKNSANWVISGSEAAFVIIDSPFANTAAIKAFPVAPTDEISKFIRAPFKPFVLAII